MTNRWREGLSERWGGGGERNRDGLSERQSEGDRNSG